MATWNLDTDGWNATTEGYEYDTLIGREVIYTTFDGERLTGIAEAPMTGPAGDGHYPIVRFADNKWARLDSVVELA